VQFAQIRDPAGGILASIGNVPATPVIMDVLGKPMVRGDRLLLFTLPIWLSPVEVDDLDLHDSAPEQPRQIGWAVLAISLQGLVETQHQMLLGGLVMTLLALLATYFVALVLGERLSAPLHGLAETVADLGKGNLAARAQTNAKGELRQLQLGVNDMAAALQQSQESLEQRIQEATADLAAQKEAAEKANADKSRFLAATSHDLRQPMHALGLFAGALKEMVTTPDQVNLVGKIEDSVHALEGMFNMLLDVSRLEAGIIEPHPQAVLLQPLLHRVAQEWQDTAGEKGLRLKVRGSRLAVRSDPILLARILNNLVKNALRYTDAGGVLVTSRRRGGLVVLEVWDTGVGIEPQHLEHIFKEYYQVDNAGRNRARGLGLGLFIVQRLCTLLGHDIRVRSRRGKGSVFSITLPVVEVDLGQIPESRQPGRFDREWVLLMEDDEQAATAMRVLLEGWGLRVQTAVDPASAMRTPSDLGGPALILSDYRLGSGVTGVEAVVTLRQFFGRPVPAILVSGDTSQEGMAEMEQSGMPILHKPVRPAKLRALLNHLIERGGMAESN
jgi:signal transduction histidine kinase/CheY-like chemotaxis protein